MTSRAPARRGTRRDELIDIAAKLFADQGYARATIRDIAREANMLSGSLYHHFTSKEQIAEEIVGRYWTALFERTDEILRSDHTPTDKLVALIDRTLMLDAELHVILQFILNDWGYLVDAFPWLLKHMDSLESKWTGVLRAGVRCGEFRSDLDPALMYRSIMASINGMNRWFKPGRKTSMERVAAAQVALWLRAVGPDEGQSDGQHRSTA